MYQKNSLKIKNSINIQKLSQFYSNKTTIVHNYFLKIHTCNNILFIEHAVAMHESLTNVS